jgi:DNA-binding response OmpR family regulator
LIVDASRDSRDVLRTLLEHRGVTTLETPYPEEAVQLADQFLPNLIVLDAESDQSPGGKPTNDLREAAARTDTPIVILGKFRQERWEFARDQFVAKPYHYGPLIRKINDLLAAA